MFKNLGKALAIMLAGAGGGRALSPQDMVHRDRKAKMDSVFGAIYGSGNKQSHKPYTGDGNNKRTTAAAQRRAKIKRANKRKNPRGSK